MFAVYFPLASAFFKHLVLLVRISWYSCYLFFPSNSFFALFSFYSFLCFILTLFVLFLLFCFLSGLYYIYTNPVLFPSSLNSVFCVFSFFVIIIMLNFLSMCLCQFIWLFSCIILTFYCIFFPSVLFCCSNFPLFSLLFFYIATIFSQSFSFSSNRLYVWLLSWHTIMSSGVSSSVLQRDMLCLIHFWRYILFSTYVIWYL